MPKVIPAEAAALDDLRARLRATRWPDMPEEAGWELGIDVACLRDLVAYWADGFDWRAQESALDQFPHVRRNGVHAIHARGVGPAPFPLVLCHGWPDSFWRYLKVIPLLTDPGGHGGDPADAFDVVVPDMPGYGYSARPAQPLNAIDVADLWAALMTDLGHRRFGAAGGDMGSHVARYLALDHPDRVTAVHRTDVGLPVFTGDPASLSREEREFLRHAAEWGAREGAYGMMHRTKPQTAAVGLNDSPAGLAAWIVEKMHAWSDPGYSFTRDDLLTNVTIYWLTGTIGSSIRMYHANAAIDPAQLQRRVEVPSGFTLFAGDVVRPPHAWLHRVANTVRINEVPRGGHFAPFEQPEAYARELRDFFRPYR
ncbi:multidrug MFS transporter [Paractinoplanes abujensis]|uniref:Pimeloyl-ACP methyl ester carboxylesterase n=1 Tax=Paractinoplanes abujensis TaxID=882441 RepID=A0A7W7CMY9_9ACTN|nr:epoxide hydrolase family protein [Actinoplanes abujensis]MBB4691249.1 pimeloyl-ACP methyl ester carboxylesterase [Actinoplanes abujensis]GID17336.1 multidrug MFS transporter [Actinoplanes abujensis]